MGHDMYNYYSILTGYKLRGVWEHKRAKRAETEGPNISLLFVICMEYFSRIMGVVANQEGFKYYTKCSSLKLNHLIFADDVLLFSKSAFQAILLTLRGLRTFSDASGLYTSAPKSSIFSANMTTQEVTDLCEMTGYSKGTLPFKYLGVPISPKKISKMDCEVLIDKLTTRIRSWGSRHLSYAGRAMLINSVLLHVHSYWASMFLLPKPALKGIITICRNFLWDGKANTAKTPLIAWDLACRPERQGGLGITECIAWNEAAIGKYVWNITQKTDNLTEKITRCTRGRKNRELAIAALASLIYKIWKARNVALWEHKVPRPEQLTDQVKQERKYKQRCSSVRNKVTGTEIGY
ncbi:uncharacterized protein LOC132039236 [Lycium ferocissimum]|uniref:uncharacterized protein LOC132039236 n=1 Tax=Lycium ferocissimum TaxID=112874 RepID=UPI002815B14B|nr:uncharacterized protein LOC132039236 [Lycium ferocissimum]